MSQIAEPLHQFGRIVAARRLPEASSVAMCCLVVGQVARFGFDVMLAFTAPEPIESGSFVSRRAIAIANANLFRAMARRALRDGEPQAKLRAANARAAARIVLRQARRDAAVHRMTAAALVASL